MSARKIPAPTQRYTVDENIYASNDIATFDNERLQALVARALTGVPAAIVDKVYARCRFLVVDHSQSVCIPANYLKGKSLIALSDSHFKRGKRERILFTILHEVAHFHLGHDYGKPGTTLESVDRNEREASKLARVWLRQIDPIGRCG